MSGLDLEGNTYWEFRDSRGEGPLSRMRRIVKYPSSTHYGDVRVPPQWHQWLRHQRREAPSLREQAAEMARQEQMKVRAAEADARWAAKPSMMDRPPEQKGQLDPPLNTGEAQPQEQAATDQRPTPDGSERETAVETSAPPGGREMKKDPWKRPTGPSETWQPDAWTPTSAKRR